MYSYKKDMLLRFSLLKKGCNMKKYKTQDAVDIVLGKRESSFTVYSIVSMRNIPQIVRELEKSFL